MKDINLLSLDLEMNKPSGSIIQIGAVVGNLSSGKVLDRLCSNIIIDEEISEYITKLTGIKQEHVNNGITLLDGYHDLIDLFRRNDCKGRGITLGWGGGDTRCLRTQLGLNEEEFFFGRRYIDVKTTFINYRLSLGLGRQAGLSKAMSKVGLQFQGKKHNALADAENTFKLYRELLTRITE